MGIPANVNEFFPQYLVQLLKIIDHVKSGKIITLFDNSYVLIKSQSSKINIRWDFQIQAGLGSQEDVTLQFSDHSGTRLRVGTMDSPSSFTVVTSGFDKQNHHL